MFLLSSKLLMFLSKRLWNVTPEFTLGDASHFGWKSYGWPAFFGGKLHVQQSLNNNLKSTRLMSLMIYYVLLFRILNFAEGRNSKRVNRKKTLSNACAQNLKDYNCESLQHSPANHTFLLLCKAAILQKLTQETPLLTKQLHAATNVNLRKLHDSSTPGHDSIFLCFMWRITKSERQQR